MDLERFGASPVGNLVPLTGTDGRTGDSYSHFGFAPDPLGDLPPLSNTAWSTVARASHALGRLQQGAQLVPNPGLLRRPTLRREAQSTSALEGTFAPLEEVLAADVIDDRSRSSALSEVLNYVRAAELAFDWISERDITVSLFGELQRTLVEGTTADTREAGRIRTIPVAIGSRSGSIYDARFVPMPPGPTLEAGVRDLVDWIRNSAAQGRDPVVAAAMAHYQFETLHPFNDGNGRLGRLLIVLQLLLEQTLSEPLLSVSPWFEARRDAYQEALAEVSATGSWDEWITFFATGIEASAIDTAQRMAELLAIQASYQERIRQSGVTGSIRDIADLLVDTPYVTVSSIARTTGKTYQAAKNALEKLVQLGILEEVEGPSVRVFRAPDVLRATTRPSESAQRQSGDRRS